LKNRPLDPAVQVWQADVMAKKVKKPKAKKPAKRDFAQSALAGVEKIIGGRLANGMGKKPR
jgi:hypothetical protein